MKVVFLHPDLGVGGAERLIVDAAVELRSRDHQVTIYTSHHDRRHCFEETKDGSLPVVVHGDWLPMTLFDRLYIFFAWLRSIWLVTCLYVLRSDTFKRTDIFFVDQMALTLPLLRLLTKASAWILGLERAPPIAFYCHYPDKLLAKPGGAAKRAYRFVFDRLEEYCLHCADIIYVNSQFTLDVFRESFPSFRHNLPTILYPGVKISMDKASAPKEVVQFSRIEKLFESAAYFISVNRFEKKKHVQLAVEAFALLQRRHEKNKILKLVIAGKMPSDLERLEFQSLFVLGGYDARVSENVVYLEELLLLCHEHELKPHVMWTTPVNTAKHQDSVLEKAFPEIPLDTMVLFLPSVSGDIRNWLMEHATGVLYTPPNEHFGIVPLEAMALGSPIVALNSGGPKESILDGKTGFLSEFDAESYSAKMMACLDLTKAERMRLKSAAQSRVHSLFTMTAFCDRIELDYRRYMTKIE